MCYRFYIDLFFKRKVNKLMAEKGIFVPDRDLGKLISQGTCILQRPLWSSQESRISWQQGP